MSDAVIEAAKSWVPGLRMGAGGNWLGFCPLHGEEVGRSKPSFSINTKTGLWQCFAGCGGGPLPLLLKKLGKSEVYQEKVLGRLKPHLTDSRSLRRKTLKTAPRRFTTSYKLPEKLLGLWQYAPVDLIDKGFDEWLLQDHDIGFDPRLKRITYPIRDLHGNLAGVSGKPVAGDGAGKYVVYERELVELGFKNYHFNNRDYCWRWDRVYPVIYHSHAKAPVYVAEGFKAALWLVQSGCIETVALMGTSLSVTQQAFLERLGVPIILCLDNDAAGRKGTAKALRKLRGQEVYVMRYPCLDLQPDDLDEEEVQAATTTPMTPFEWKRAHYGT